MTAVEQLLLYSFFPLSPSSVIFEVAASLTLLIESDLCTFRGCVKRLKFTLAAHKTKTMADNSYSLQFPAVQQLILCGRRRLP